MGFFGHKGHFSKLGHNFNKTLKHYDEVLRSHNAPDIYVGVKSTDDGQSWQPSMQSVDKTVTTGQRYNYGNVGRSSTTAYKANTAGTANKIAQGGMTKDDILKYNEIHPNEIAGDSPANTTALNTNTAIRSK